MLKLKKSILILIFASLLIPQDASSKISSNKVIGIFFGTFFGGIIASMAAGIAAEELKLVSQGKGGVIFVGGSALSVSTSIILAIILSNKTPYAKFNREFEATMKRVNKNPILIEILLDTLLQNDELIKIIHEEYSQPFPVTKALIDFKKIMLQLKNLRKLIVKAKRDQGSNVLLTMDEQELIKLYKIVQEKIEFLKDCPEIKQEYEKLKPQEKNIADSL